MKIYLITPIYAITTQEVGATPVVHYFAKEWVKKGHDVTVFNYCARYPRVFYFIGKHFQHKINTKLGQLIPIRPPKEIEYQADGVKIYVKLLKKTIPHAKYKLSQINKAIGQLSDYCERNGLPDVFIGHWDSPQLDILSRLKDQYPIKTCLVLHSNVFELEKKYGDGIVEKLKKIDIIGFRNIAAYENYSAKYGQPSRHFIAYSGVSESFLDCGKKIDKHYELGIHKFVFTGSLIQRKYPIEILTALNNSFPDGNFEITYIGDGAEKGNIIALHRELGNKGVVRFTGRIAREEVLEYLKEADVFVMISKGEIFGLVYLEAMALGLIPIGSKGEGIDGIIVNGDNGFLCDAGNAEELKLIIDKIKCMSGQQLIEMSNKAKQTAFDFSDDRVAEKYLNYVINN